MSLNGRYTIKDITGRLGESAEQLTEVERKHFTNIENGPMKSNKKRFEEILIPCEIQERLFRWTGEFDLCYRTSCIGKALDVITEMHCEFLAQFTQIADIRVRCLEAPTKFMVAPMHYYDRALDGLLISIASARKSINKLFAELNSVKGECHEKFNAAEKMYREVECDALCDKNGEASGMQKFIKQRKEKAALFSELETRVGTVIDGGGSMFCWVGKTWLQGSAGSKEGLVEGKMGPSDDDGDSNGKDARQEEGEEARSKCTEREEVDVGSKEDENALSSQHGARSDEIIPITPECEIINGVAVTQRSSPRKRVKNRNRSRERLLDNAQECVAVARSLMVDQVGHVGHSPGQKSGKSIQAVGNIETGFRDRRKSGSSDGDEGEECMGETVENVAEAALRSGWEKGNIGNWNEVRDVDGDCDKHQRLSV